MDPIRWFLRAKRWAQKPPSEKQVLLVLGVIAACLSLYAADRWIGLPEWMHLTPASSRDVMR
jgi:hypothetical protein